MTDPETSETQPPSHFLLTRFNVAQTEAVETRRGLAPEWLAQRFELFTEWTVPSVRRQTVAGAAWLIFVDSATPPDYIDRLTEATVGVGRIVPVAGLLSDARIGELVLAELDATTATLVTSRLDSDDALSSHYSATVIEYARNWRGFLNAPHGLLYADGLVLRRWDNRGPFLSMVEDLTPGRPPLTAFCVEHFKARTIAPTRQMSGRPMWVQVIHGTNLGNRISGVPYSRTRAESALGWPLPADDSPNGGWRNAPDLARALYAEVRWAAGGIAERSRAVVRRASPQRRP